MPTFAVVVKWSLLLTTIFTIETTVRAQQFPGSTFDVSYPGISTACTTALNISVDCPPLLGAIFRFTPYLAPAELTAVCNDKCIQSLETTRQAIQTGCNTDTDVITSEGMAYPATWLVDHFIYAYNSSCQKDSQTGQFCDTLVQTWQNQTNLTQSQGCSDCVLRTMQVQLSSPFGYTNDSNQAFASKTSSCQAAGYSVTSPAQYALSQTVPSSSTPSATPTSTCQSEYRIRQDDTCNSIALSQNVSTFGLTHMNHLGAYCKQLPDQGTSLCLPDPCHVYTLQPKQNCFDVVRQQSEDITVTQLQAWNPNINRRCGNLDRLSGTVICVSPPGGFRTYEPQTTSNLSVAGSVAPRPTNAQKGTKRRCAKYHTVRVNNTCSSLSTKNGISLPDLYFLNPELNQTDCSNLRKGKAYCVQAVGSVTTYAQYGSTPTGDSCKGPYPKASCFGNVDHLPDTPLIAGNATMRRKGKHTRLRGTAASATPSALPHASGTASGCYKYSNAFTGLGTSQAASSLNNCTTIAFLYGTTVADLVAWNPSLDQGAKCVLQPGYGYCVQRKAPAMPSSVPSLSVEDRCEYPATSTVQGTALSCTCFTTVYGFDKDKYSCKAMAGQHNITITDLRNWNAWIQGADCTSGLYATLDENESRAVCVGTTMVTSPMDSNQGASLSTSTMSKTVPSAASSAYPTDNSNPEVSVVTVTRTTAISTTICPLTVTQDDVAPSISAMAESTASTTESSITSSTTLSSASSIGVSNAIPYASPTASASSSAFSSASSTAASSAASSAAPTQTDTIQACKQYYTVQQGDTCASVESAYGLIFDNLHTWNPSVGNDCENLWVGYRYCIGV